MNSILGCNCVLVSGAVADKTYNGEGFAVGPGTGAISLTLGTSERAVAPAAALGAAGVGVADRVQRLLFPPNTTRAWCAQTLTLGLFAARADRGRRADHDSVDVLSVRDDHLTRGDPRREGTMARPDRPTR